MFYHNDKVGIFKQYRDETMADQPLLPAPHPRRIDPKATFDSIAGWIAQTAKHERAPGLIVGLSGTDSILTFLACARAFEMLGKPGKVLGLNFEHSSKNDFAGTDQPFTCARSSFNWVARDIFPWLREQAPQAQLEIDDTIPHSDDNKRWGHLFSRAVSANDPRHGLLSEHFFPVGTRNATEQALGTYSQLSKSVSMLPIVDLYKTEVLDICEYLGVPQIAIDKSREIDCDCGRFDTQANHMRELDLFIMHKKGELTRDYIDRNIPKPVLAAVMEFYVEERANNDYRPRTPYTPQQTLVVTMP